MSTAARAPARKSTAPLPRRGAPVRPQLAVVPAPVRTSRIPPAALVVLGVIALFLVLIGLAGFQASLVSSRERLDELERRVAIEQDRYQDLRVDVARLEAPERILAAATYQLGMVPAGTPVYVTPTGEVVAEVETRVAEAEAEVEAPTGSSPGDVNDVAAEAGSTTDAPGASWPEVKPYLEPTP